MKLKVKDVNLSAGGPYVAILNVKDAEKLDVHALGRIRIKSKTKELVVLVNISDKGINPGEIGLFDEVLAALNVKHKDTVTLNFYHRPNSIWSIKKKLDGEELEQKEIDEIIKGIVGNELTTIDLTYFISGVYTNGLTLKETTWLTEAIVKNGGVLKSGKKILLDKHCIGGVAGNRTTMIVVPIIAAAGYPMIKTSSRSITSPAGTADTMEVLAPVNLGVEKIKTVMKKANACMVWGGAFELASADDAIIQIERILSLDPQGMLLASIMAKKKAVGATHLLIDIPVGRGAKFESRKKAKDLKKLFIKLGKQIGIKVEAIITDGSQPIGRGIGPVLEARDVISVLTGDGPSDLRAKAIYMASKLLKMAGQKNPKKTVIELIDSGKALKKFREIIIAQGGHIHFHVSKLMPGKHFKEYYARRTSTITHIDNKIISKIARIAGAPKDKGAGIYLHAKVGKKIKRGELLFTLYSESSNKLEYAKEYMKTTPFPYEFEY